jgi:hypothetical protein
MTADGPASVRRLVARRERLGLALCTLGIAIVPVPVIIPAGSVPAAVLLAIVIPARSESLSL